MPPKALLLPRGLLLSPSSASLDPSNLPWARQSQAAPLHTLPYLKHCSLGAEFPTMREKDAGKTQLKEV